MATETTRPADARQQEIVVSGGDYEHVLGFAGTPGEVPAIRYVKTALGELSRRVLNGEDFDVAEYSLANYIMLKERGDDRLSAIPVFPSRAFRNASVFVRQDSPLRDPRALAGCTVGINEFAMTTAVWTRGHLHDDCGLDWKGINWITGGNPRFPPPPGIRATATQDDLETMVLDGRIDALMAGKPRDLQFPPSQRRLRPVAADTEAIERRFYATTGLFPIMHTVVLHSSLAAIDGAPRRIFEAYARTKKATLKRRLSASFLPFSEREWDKLCPPGAPDPYQHGLTDFNRRNVATLARYLLEQGLISRMPEIDALFAPGSAAWLDG